MPSNPDEWEDDVGEPRAEDKRSVHQTCIEEWIDHGENTEAHVKNKQMVWKMDMQSVGSLKESSEQGLGTIKMNEEDYLNWVLKQTRHGAREKRNADAIKYKLMLYKFVPRRVNINVNEPLGIRPATTIGMSYIISGILLCQWFL